MQEETIKKIKKARARQLPPRPRGFKMSEEQKRKIGLANRGKVRSLEQRVKMGLRMTGKNIGQDNPCWRGGKSISMQGYIRFNKNYQQEHRRILEEFLQRKLSPIEIVHHINGNKLDNRMENLAIVSRSEHARIHQLGRRV